MHARGHAVVCTDISLLAVLDLGSALETTPEQTFHAVYESEVLAYFFVMTQTQLY